MVNIDRAQGVQIPRSMTTRYKDLLNGIHALVISSEETTIAANQLIGFTNGTFAFEFFMEVARGNVSGWKMFSVPGKKVGISNTVLDDISEIPGTTVIPDPGGIQLEIVSSSGSDDGNPIGIGAQTVMIHYLDDAGLEQAEIKTMNGVTAVLTVATNIDKIQWIHVIDVGSNTTSVGNISLQGVGGGTVYEYITAGGNQSLSCRYHVPSDKTGFITGWQASAITKVIDFRLRANVGRATQTVQQAFNFQDVILLDAAPSGWIPFEVPKLMPSNSTVKGSGLSFAAGGDAGMQFDIILVDN